MHAQSNGQVERFVQTIKRLIKKTERDNGDINIALLNYRNTTLDGIGASPPQLLMSRKLRTKIPTVEKELKPTIQTPKITQINKKQTIQKKYFDKTAGIQHKKLLHKDNIKYLDHKKQWRTGKITNNMHKNKRDYKIINTDNRIIRRNRKYIYKVHNKNIKKTANQIVKNQQYKNNHTQPDTAELQNKLKNSKQNNK